MNLNCSSDNVLHVEGALVISFTRDISADTQEEKSISERKF